MLQMSLCLKTDDIMVFLLLSLHLFLSIFHSVTVVNNLPCVMVRASHLLFLLSLLPIKERCSPTCVSTSSFRILSVQLIFNIRRQKHISHALICWYASSSTSMSLPRMTRCSVLLSFKETLHISLYTYHNISTDLACFTTSVGWFLQTLSLTLSIIQGIIQSWGRNPKILVLKSKWKYPIHPRPPSIGQSFCTLLNLSTDNACSGLNLFSYPDYCKSISLLL